MNGAALHEQSSGTISQVQRQVAFIQPRGGQQAEWAEWAEWAAPSVSVRAHRRDICPHKSFQAPLPTATAFTILMRPAVAAGSHCFQGI